MEELKQRHAQAVHDHVLGFVVIKDGKVKVIWPPAFIHEALGAMIEEEIGS